VYAEDDPSRIIPALRLGRFIVFCCRTMGMRMLKIEAERRRSRERGFSLLEMMMVVALIIILGAMTFITWVPLMQQQHVTNAYNTTMAAMRQARDNAVAQRTSYAVTFTKSTSSSSVTVAPTITGFQGDQNSLTYQLPPDVAFDAEPAVASTPTPDGFGTGSNAIDFGYLASGTGTGGQTVVYFCPDGSAQNTTSAGSCPGSGNWSGGVIYIARPGNLLSSRALSLWGGTGRIRGWRLYPTSGGYQWIRQ
jgi:prepilin-type N-terminal cleavage/methylation domain-containing protein